MDQSVRVSLFFPRSGQQLYVHLPHHMAQVAEADIRKIYPAYGDSSPTNSNHTGNNNHYQP